VITVFDERVARPVLAVFFGAIVLAWLVASIIAAGLSLALKGILKLIRFIRS
jgi:VIT1/CCC1 family predicted Fe2+/Mn2+ transporter